MEKFSKTKLVERSRADEAKATATNASNGGEQLTGIIGGEEKLGIMRQTLNSFFSL